MNKIFKVVWSKSKECYVVVSEVAKNNGGKKKVLASVLAGLAMVGAGAVGTGVQAADSNSATTMNSSNQINVWATTPENNATARGSGSGTANANDVRPSQYGDEISVAIGAKNVVRSTDTANQGGGSSVALGNKNTLKGNRNVAVGTGNKTYGEDSIAVGSNVTVATGRGIAIGNDYNNTHTIAYGAGEPSETGVTGNAFALAIGNGAQADGRANNASGGIAIGQDVKATHNNTIAMGVQAKATGAQAIAFGKGANASSSGTVAIGQVSSATQYAALAFGNQSAASGQSSVAVGRKSKASEFGTVALGYGAEATGKQSIAIGGDEYGSTYQPGIEDGAGKTTTASADNAIALGHNATANIAGGVALGSESKTTVAAGVTGYNPATGRTNDYKNLTNNTKAALTSTRAAVSIGDDSASVTRQLTGLAAGTQDTDAVNVAQLKAVNLKYAGDTGNSDVLLKDGTLNVKGDTNLISTSADATGITVTAKVGGAITANNDGKAVAPTTNGIATTTNVTDAINNSGWKANASANGGALTGSATATKVVPGDTVTFSAGKNLTVAQTLGTNTQQYTYALSSTLKDIESIQNGASKITLNNGGGTTISGGNLSVDGNKITKVAPGTDDTDAVNYSQIKGLRTEVKAGTGITVTPTKGSDGHDIYTVSSNATGGTASTESVVKKAAATGDTNIADVSVAGGKNVNDPGAQYEVSVSKNAVKDAAREAVTVNNGGNTDNPITVTPTDSATDHNTSYAVTFDGNKAAKQIPLTYKANGTGDKTVTLDKGLNFTNGTNTTAAIDNDGVVKFNLNDNVTLTNAGSLSVGGTTVNNGGLTITAPAGGTTSNVTLTQSGLDNGGNKIVNVKDGDVSATSKDAVNGSQLHAVKAAERHITPTTTGNEYTVDADGNVTMTYTDGNGAVVTGENAIIKGIAKQDLSNITNAGKKVITGLSNKVVAGDNVTVTDTEDATTGQKTYTVSANLTKVTDGTNTTVTGTGTTADPYKVNVSGDLKGITSIANTTGGPTMTIGGNSINITGGNLDLGNNKITKVAPGTDDTDAVNVKQLKDTELHITPGTYTPDANKKVKLTYTDGNNAVVTGKEAVIDLSSLATGGTASTESVVKKAAAAGDTNIADVSVAGGKNVNDPGAQYEVSVSKNAVKDAAREAVTVNNGGNTDNPITVTPTDDGANHNTSYAVTFDGNKAAKQIPLTYKANGTGDKTVTLDKGLNFTNGTNTTAEIDNDGVVKFNLNDNVALTNAGSLTVGGTTVNNGGLTITAPAGGTTSNVTLTQSGLDNGGNKIVNVKDGDVSATSKDAVNGSQLHAVKAAERHITPTTTGNEYTVDADGNVTMTYTDGNGAVVTGENAVIKGIAKQDLSNINNDGKKEITKLGTIVKAGDNVTVSEASDATTGQKTYTVNAVTPAVYTKADGTKVVKRPNGTYTTNLDGSAGNDVPASDVIVSFQDAAGNTTGGSSIVNNVGSAIDKTGTSTGDTFLTNLNDAATATPFAAVNVRDLKSTADALKASELHIAPTAVKAGSTEAKGGAASGAENVYKYDAATKKVTLTYNDGNGKAVTDTKAVIDFTDLNVPAGGNNYGFKANATANGGTVEGTATETAVENGGTVNFAAGKNLTVKQDLDATNKTHTYTFSLDKDLTNLDKVVVNGKDGIAGKDGVTIVGPQGATGATGIPGTNGIDGKVGITGKDGKDAVSIAGKDGVGTIGLTGPQGPAGTNGKSVDISTENGTKTLVKPEANNNDQSQRIVYVPKDANGNPLKDADNNDIKREVATMDDGLKFTGNNTSTENKQKLGSLVKVQGEGTKEGTDTAGAKEIQTSDGTKFESAKDNIAVEADGANTLTVKLNKDLKGLNSVTTEKVITKEIDLSDPHGTTTATIKYDDNRITYTNDGGQHEYKVANLNDEKHITKGEYTVGDKSIDPNAANDEVTLTYTSGYDELIRDNAGNPITTKIKGIAKSDLSNITNEGKKEITKLGTIVKAGDNVTVSEASDATTGQKTYTVNAVTPAVYTKADGTKVVKRPDGTFTTNVDGAPGNDVPASDVIVSFQDAAGNRTGGNSIVNNVGSAIDKAGTSTGDTFLTNLNNAATATPFAAVNVRDLKSTADALKASELHIAPTSVAAGSTEVVGGTASGNTNPGAATQAYKYNATTKQVELTFNDGNGKAVNGPKAVIDFSDLNTGGTAASSWNVKSSANTTDGGAIGDNHDAAAQNIADNKTVEFQAGKNLVVKQTNDAANGNATVEFSLSDNITAGKDGANGKDGSVGATGKDGSSVVLNGKDGSIGMTGPKGQDGKDGINGRDGANISITSAKGEQVLVNRDPAHNGDTDKAERIVYVPKDANGNPIQGADGKNIVREVATMDDGLRFTGNNTSTENKQKLGSLVKVEGEGVTEAQANSFQSAAGNIAVVADGADKLTVKLNKDLKGLDSVTTKEVKLGDANDNISIKKDGDRITYSTDGGTTVNKVANLADEKHIKDTTYTVDANTKTVTLTYVDGNGTDVANKKAIIDLSNLPVGDKDTDMRIKEGDYTAKNGSVTLNTVDKDGNPVAGKDVVIKGINTNNYQAGDNVTFTNDGNDANGNPIVKINAKVSTEQVVAKAGNDNLATVAPATGSTQGGQNATYEVNVDKTNLENKAEISYKASTSTDAGSQTAKKTTLANGFDFTSDDHSVAITTGANGKVNFKVDTTGIQGKAFNLDVEKEGTGKVENAQTAATTPSVEKGTKFVAGNNLSIRHDAINGDNNYDHKVTYALNSDLKGITSITNNGGATMNFGPNEISMTGGNLNMGDNKITNVKNGTDKSDVATVGQLTKVTSNDNSVSINKSTDADGAPVYDLSVQGGRDPRVDELGEEIGRVGAQGAALAALKPIQYDPLEPTQIMAGYGNYRGNSAIAMGVAHYKNESTLMHAGLSWAGGSRHMMANAGVTWKVGNRDSEAAVADRYRKGPISSAYAMQQEMASVKAQNAGLKTEVSDLKAENEQMKAQIAAMMAKLGM